MAGNHNSGRPRTPAAIRLSRGAQKSKVNKNEIILPSVSGAPDCPDYVCDDVIAKEQWDKNVRILQAMKILTEGDLGILACLCHSEAIMRRAAEEINLYGITIENRETGMRAANPAVRILNSQRALVYQLSNQLGLTPNSRLRLQPLPEGPKKNKFSALQEETMGSPALLKPPPPAAAPTLALPDQQPLIAADANRDRRPVTSISNIN